MSDHSVGAIEFLRSVLPDAVETLFAAVTYLGDPWLLLVVLLLTYWFVDRELGIRVMGLALGASALVLILKNVFALGRPAVGPPVPVESIPALVRPLYHGAIEPGGYAFPSGHSIGATVTWGALAWLSDVADRRRRLTAAGTVVTLVATSRVVLGVHFAADVVGGVIAGVAFLAVALVAVERVDVDRVTATLAVALVGGVLALPVAGYGDDPQLVIGAGIGALAAWTAVEVPTEPWPASHSGAAFALAGLLVLAAPLAASTTISIPGEMAFAMAVAVAGVVGLPAVLRGESGSGTVERGGENEGPTG